MGFSKGGTGWEFDWNKAWNGAMQGLTQGIVSIGLDYLTEELDLDPLLGNIAYAIVATGIEGLFSEKGLFKHMADTYKNALGKMFGYNPAPNMYDKIYWEFDAQQNAMILNEQRYLSDLNSYEQNRHWFETAHMANVIEFSNIIQEQGLEVALNTYATSLFNGVAVNAITNLADIGIKEIGTYISNKLNAYDSNPGNVSEVTRTVLPDGTIIYKVAIKDKYGNVVCEFNLEEKVNSQTGNIYRNYLGFELPDGYEIYGDYLVDPETQYAEMNKGFISNLLGDVEVTYDVFIDESGTRYQGTVQMYDLSTGKTTIVKSLPDKDFFGYTDTNGFYTNAVIEDGWTINDVFNVDKTYHIIDGKVSMIEEMGDVTLCDRVYESTFIEDGVVIQRFYDEEGAFQNLKIIAKRVILDNFEFPQISEINGQEVILLCDGGDSIKCLILDGNQIWSTTVDDMAELVAFTRMRLKNGMQLPDDNPTLDEMVDNVILQLDIDGDISEDDMITSIADVRDMIRTMGITDNMIGGEQLVETSYVDLDSQILEGTNTEFWIEKYLRFGNVNGDNIIITDTTKDVAYSRHKSNNISEIEEGITISRYDMLTKNPEGERDEKVVEVSMDILLENVDKTYHFSMSSSIPVQISATEYDIYIVSEIYSDDDKVGTRFVSKFTVNRDIYGDFEQFRENLENNKPILYKAPFSDPALTDAFNIFQSKAIDKVLEMNIE